MSEHQSLQLADKRYLTVKEAATLLGVNIKTIYRAIAARELPARRIRRSLRVPRKAILGDGDCDHGAGYWQPAGRGTLRGQEAVVSLEE